MKETCLATGCVLKETTRGLCEAHYRRWLKATPLDERPTFLERTLERFWKKVDLSNPDGCWVWTAGVGQYGHGKFGIERRGKRATVFAHRFAYEALVGEIPKGLVLDHLCRNTRCVNPAHLDPVTNAENVARGDAPAALQAVYERNRTKTHCKRGHEFTAGNTRIGTQGQRVCRSCHREYKRERTRRERECV